MKLNSSDYIQKTKDIISIYFEQIEDLNSYTLELTGKEFVIFEVLIVILGKQEEIRDKINGFNQCVD